MVQSAEAVKGGFYGTTREDEEKKFEEIRKITEEKVKAIKKTASDLQEDLKSLREVYDADDKEGLAQWFNTDARFAEVRKDLNRAERARHKPFFGRIDIIDEEGKKKETFYIGKTVVAENPSEPLVIDWRAPVSSVYYDHGLGKCRYKVPKEGYFLVDLKRKRTYEIEDDKIKDFYDSDVVANDDLLTKYLSKSKRNVLSEIIATIQKEQNEVIRKNPRHNVLVQGSAGSGKTTVAMHRISYILYNYELEFKPESFYIVGSNKVLLNYITGVLPDLDVYGVRQMTMEDLFVRLLYEDWDKAKHKIRKLDKKDKSSVVKASTEWFSRLSDFCLRTEKSLIPQEDIKIERTGRTILSSAKIKKAIEDFKDFPLIRKFERLNDLLTVGLENEIYGRYYSYNVEEQKKLTQHFKNWFDRFYWQKSVFELYEAFLDEMRAEIPGIVFVKNEPDLYDLASLAYIYKRIKEKEVIQEASHVVIDEAQDFGIAVYRSLKYCMSKCTFTIMGDVSQNINFGLGLSDWEELKKVMLPEKYDFFGLLRKSYRNTVEISSFATDILRHGTFPIYPVEPIIRHGEDVFIKECKTEEEHINALLSKISEYKEKGHETIAIICRDSREAKLVKEKLAGRVEVGLFSEGDGEFSKGVYALPIEYSKGLEFDAVIVFDATREAYPSEDGYVKLLYVAATRALHDLSVFAKGELTGLIKDPIPEDRKNISFVEDDFHEKPFEFEEEFKTKDEIAKEQAREGDRERALRDMYGPTKIIVRADGTVDKGYGAGHESKKPSAHTVKAGSNRPVAKVESHVKNGAFIGESLIKKPEPAPIKREPSARKTSEFNSMPEGTLTPVGHGKIDNSVRWIAKEKGYVEITGAYGMLRIVPVSDETVRILFAKAGFDKIRALPEEIKKKEGLKWVVRESKDTLEIVLEKLTVKIEKRVGALTFISKAGLLLSEKTDVCRQYHGGRDVWWDYFDWSKKEVLTARGNDDSEWSDLTGAAKYVSFGRESDRSAVIMSNRGYQILVPGGVKTLCCTIPMYGPYLCFEDTEYMDYCFRAAR